MKIITISREFGSGGRELGKRLADIMSFDYYDSEIISDVAEKSGLDPNYVEGRISPLLFEALSVLRHICKQAG